MGKNLDPLRELGTIKLLQVQKSSLKVGIRPNARYEPGPLIHVPKVMLMKSGVIGIYDDETNIVDRHNWLHSDHRNKRSKGISNGISIGFASHYQMMREAFGEHVSLGIAGENIIVETDDKFLEGTLGDYIYIESASTGTRSKLDVFGVASPCVEYAQFCANESEGLSRDQMKRTLQKLNDGMRGYFLEWTDKQEYAEVAVGDVVMVQ